MAEPVPLWGEVHKIRQPVLLCWGRDDRVAPVEGALFPARRMSRADLRIYSRCGHWVQIERKDDFERRRWSSSAGSERAAGAALFDSRLLRAREGLRPHNCRLLWLS